MRWTATPATLLAIFWVAASFASRAQEKDLHCQWAFTRLAWSRPHDAYRPEALGAVHGPEPLSHRCEMSYPPILPLLYAPLGLLDARSAAIAHGLAHVLLAAAASMLISRASDGRLSSWGAFLALLTFPAFYYDLALGQNAIFTLVIVAAAWLSLVRGKALLAGLWLAALAYKPQWLAATIWIPAVLSAWRAYLGLAAGLGVLLGASLVFLGPAIWQEWLPIILWKAGPSGERREELRMAIDVRNVTARLIAPAAPSWAWLAPALLLALTLILLGRAARRDRRSPAAAGLWIASILAAPHAMYYDALILLLPASILWAHRHELPSRGHRLGLMAALALLWLSLPLQSLAAGWPRFEGPPLVTLSALALACAGSQTNGPPPRLRR